jgi:diaminopimelate epimerase
VTCENGVVHLTKHEGAGNDFLVVLDPDDRLRLSGDQIRLLCHRHRGLGADGVIRVGRGGGAGGVGADGADGPDGADLTMQLHNADGGEAEMSGNGIRCLAQAAVDAGWVTPPTFSVATAGGLRTVTFLPGEEPGWARASVDMGAVSVGPAQEEIDGRTARTADVGNPHLVLVGPGVAGVAGAAGLARVEIETRGPQLQAAYPDGINVEWIELAHDADGDFLELRVWERGAGETLACGTGSVAAAAVARAVNLVGGSGPVRVHNPGGLLEVTLGRGADTPAVLAGPVRKVADIELHPGMLS